MNLFKGAASNSLKQNNFDFIRLIFSIVVCLVHSHDLSGAPELQWVDRVMSSRVAVEGFFILSGFLIFMSYDKSDSLMTYFKKRVRRLYPAYLIVILLSGFGFWVITSIPGDYFTWPMFKYVIVNLLFLNFLQPTLPGVFQSNTTSAVNGALWSLKIEVMFYLAVPIVVWFFRFGRLKILGLLYIASLAWVFICEYLANSHGPIWNELARQLPGAMRFFVTGALIYYYINFFKTHILWLMLLALLALLVSKYTDINFIYPLSLGVLVCFVSLFGYIGNIGKYGDFSYGLYILHFPVLQVLISLGIFERHPYFGQFLGVFISLLFAVFLWHCIEKRFLGKSNHYLASSS